MLSDSPLAEPTIPEPERHDRRLRPAVVVSLLLHLALVLALARVTQTPSQRTTVAADTRAVRVIIATTSPQRRNASSAAIRSGAGATATPDAPTMPAPVDAASPGRAAPDATEPASGADATPAAEPGTDAQAGTVLDMQSLQNSISSYTNTYKRDVLEQELQECQQYRDRYQRWDCPQDDEVKSATRERIDEGMDATFRAWVSGYDRNARISAELLSDMDALRPLMEDEGVLGTLARERYYLKADQYIYLGPDVDEGGVITLVTFDLNGIVVLHGLLTIGLDGEINVLDKQPALPFDEDDE